MLVLRSPMRDAPIDVGLYARVTLTSNWTRRVCTVREACHGACRKVDRFDESTPQHSLLHLWSFPTFSGYPSIIPRVLTQRQEAPSSTQNPEVRRRAAGDSRSHLTAVCRSSVTGAGLPDLPVLPSGPVPAADRLQTGYRPLCDVHLLLATEPRPPHPGTNIVIVPQTGHEHFHPHHSVIIQLPTLRTLSYWQPWPILRVEWCSGR
jgi:hypothetical protein